MKYDALAYFYHNRSGIAIEMPYAGGQQWTRPAGHLPDMAPCAPDVGCTYTLDVSKGWYDAGDHGKYVVNGGISVWTMLNQYERFQHLGTTVGDFGDGKLSIPEGSNGVPDILDEARWELEFMLQMQVPDGNPSAGMVHHKIHDNDWTALPTPPHLDPNPRFLRPVSTAATLNLAATAAQAARIWRDIDPDFSERCLRAAEVAWAAANQHPDVYAPVSDSTGGGPYDDHDNNITDEFYWAAVELYITTGETSYHEAYTASPVHQTLGGANGYSSAMTWWLVDALGTISLAVVPNEAGAGEVQEAKSRLVAIADKYLAILETEGYRLPFHVADEKVGYPWGSSSFVLNNGIILALANDFTGEQRYLDGVVSGLDYLLGRNPMDKSYVSGYGHNPLQNPHHRFWAHQLDASYPSAPPGAVSGGPNSGIEDPVAKRLDGCAAQKCYIDDINAWSVNEVAINWNSPLAWLTAWLDEKSK
jgi:endoglucanase